MLFVVYSLFSCYIFRDCKLVLQHGGQTIVEIE
jgi:hypothetical protein